MNGLHCKQGEKQVSMSTEDRSVEHDDYHNRRRTNYSDDRGTMVLVSGVDSMRIAA